MPQYRDLADRPEDDRITEIGRAAMEKKQTVGFMTDATPGKLERYLRKLQERFPGIVIVAQGEGPVKNVVWAKVGPPLPLTKEES